MEMNEFISVVIPIYNEEKYIENCINSLLKQDYPLNNMEWIFVDGGSGDLTKGILENFQSIYPALIKIYNNPHKTVPYAMNIGIRNSIGKYIIRLDAHSDYSKDYISKCVTYLKTTDADNVGGVAETKGRGFVGNAIANVLSSRFGVGNSQFRTNGKSGFVDTVPFGAFRREVFEKWGGYDERLTRNQDNEMNYRIRKNGGKIYLASDIHFSYYCRDTVKGISDMAIKNGMWNVITMKLCPGTMRIRHFIPFMFFSSLVLLPVMALFDLKFLILLIVELVLYFSLDIHYTCKATKNIKNAALVFCLFPIFHVTYGFGSLKGFVKLLGKEYRN